VIEETLKTWIAEDRRFAVCLLVERFGSAPLDPGAMMLVDDQGHIEGSVTGGCVESALAQEAEGALRDGAPRLLQYGVSDELAAEVGLMCGGTVRVFVHELRPEDRELVVAGLADVEAGRPTTLSTILDGKHAGAKLLIGEGEVTGGVGEELLERSIVRDARGLHETGESRVREYGEDGRADGTGIRVHHQTWATPARMVIVGVNDFARALADHAGRMGWRVIICDARQAFAQSDAVRRLAEVVVDWPHRALPALNLTARDAVVIVTHDPKFDEPAISSALESEAGYIGALGSRQTQDERRARLLEVGLDEAALARVAMPCGLDIGGRTADETAISIIAEIIADRHERDGGRLGAARGPIHGEIRDRVDLAS
jgi:xanthine dehydrogenase accessory factor